MMLLEHSMLYEHEEVTLAHNFLLQPTRPERPSEFAKPERMQRTVSGESASPKDIGPF